MSLSIPPASKVSAAFRAANPHLYGTNPTSPHPELFGDRADDQKASPDAVRAKLEPDRESGTLSARKAQKEDSGRFLVRVTSVRRILLDEDNLCEKFIVDCCRYAGLLPSDRPGKTKIEVAQRKVEKGEEEHTVVELYRVPAGKGERP